MGRTFFEYLSFITTAIGTILGGLGVYLALKSNVPITALLTGLTETLFFICVIFFFFFLIFLKKYIVHLRYAKAYDHLNQAFCISHKLREDTTMIADLPHSIQQLQEFCTYLASGFTCISNRSSSICIKLFHITTNDSVCLKTFCRDSKAQHSIKRVKPEEDETIHYLNSNTDFRYIFENADKEGDRYKYYFSNTLPLEDFYQNSRLIDSEYPPKSRIPIVKEIKRLWAWPLPYRSTIIVPITPLTDKKMKEGQIIGYLCLDSPFLWAFNRNYDIKILRGVADGLYSTMKTISEIHFQNVHKKTKQEKKKINN